MSIARLTEMVRGKEAKAREYSSCDEYWLLVVVDFMDEAQEQEIRVNGLVLASDVFGRIIIYKPYFEHVVEATCEREIHPYAFEPDGRHEVDDLL
jgi:hypothetical protein